jgi:hypothetical protein
MAKTIRKVKPWTKEDVRTLKTLAREKAKTTVIARKLKRSVAATQHKASALAVTLGGGRGKQRA